MRIRVSDVLDPLANGLTPEQVLEELPDLELEDIRASLVVALTILWWRLDHLDRCSTFTSSSTLDNSQLWS
jgi:hypothetical protein